MTAIGFANKPSVAILSIEDMQLTWIQTIEKNHAVFEQLSRVESFDYYFINDILVIPDPIPTPRVNWNKNIRIGDFQIECKGSFLVFFRFENHNQDVILADSLTFPQYEYLRSKIQCV